MLPREEWYYFFLTAPSAGMILGPPPLRLSAAAIVLTGTFFGFLVSRFPLAISYSRCVSPSVTTAGTERPIYYHRSIANLPPTCSNSQPSKILMAIREERAHPALARIDDPDGPCRARAAFVTKLSDMPRLAQHCQF